MSADQGLSIPYDVAYAIVLETLKSDREMLREELDSTKSLVTLNDYTAEDEQKTRQRIVAMDILIDYYGPAK